MIVYDSNYSKLLRGIVITDEYLGNQISVIVVIGGGWNQNYYDRSFIAKVF